MSSFLLLTFLRITLTPSTQHYIPPIDDCISAKFCNHTGIPICGVDKKHSQHRFFLDECDMFEYNCDNKQAYLISYMENCQHNPTNKVTTYDSTADTKSETVPMTERSDSVQDSSMVSITETNESTQDSSTVLISEISESVQGSSTMPITETDDSIQDSSTVSITDKNESTQDSSTVFISEIVQDSSTMPITETSIVVQDVSTVPVTEATVMSVKTSLIFSTSEPQSSNEVLTISSSINDIQSNLTENLVNTKPFTHLRECTCGVHNTNNNSIPMPIDMTATTSNTTCTVNSSSVNSVYSQSMEIVTSSMSVEVPTDVSLAASQITTALIPTQTNKSETTAFSTFSTPYPHCTCHTQNNFVNPNPTHPISTSANTDKDISTTTLPFTHSEIITSTEPSTEHKLSTQSSSVSNLPLDIPLTNPETPLTLPSSAFQSHCTCYAIKTSEFPTTKPVKTIVTPTTTLATTTSQITTTLLTTETLTESLHHCTCGMVKESTTIPTVTSKTTSASTNSIKIKEENVTITNNCAKYPKHCNIPHTWETTAEGETRDFFQILRARYGHRVKLLKDTTHYPRRAALYINSDVDMFRFGRHSDSK